MVRVHRPPAPTSFLTWLPCCPPLILRPVFFVRPWFPLHKTPPPPLRHSFCADSPSLIFNFPFLYISFILCFMASSLSSDNSTGSGRSVFDHPRRAPPPPPPSSRSARSTPEGFVLPLRPPSNDPLVITYDDRGHRQLPHVLDTPLGVEDGRVMKLVEHNSMIVPKCANCAELGVICSFTEAGVPCPPCSVLGIPDCYWVDPSWFVENLRTCRDAYLSDERDELVKSVQENRLSPSLFDREFERAQSWFYSGAQGAISRFLVNSRATCDTAIRGYHSLAAASSNPSVLLRFLSLGVEARVHPLVLQVVTDRLQSFIRSMLS
ncbi:hypothetical protein B0H10DRAFT_2305680 [Mycena sp. CBHHK59/15]|nr:hypothetical protein B0H10DRAFT_2305680 [Mycena sp. CBHHK59/15]